MAKPPQPGPHLHAFEYMYRDAGNWKTYGLVLLKGFGPPALQACIIDALDSGLYFIAEQVNLPALQHRHNVEHGGAHDDLDHAFHEFVELRLATAEDIKRSEATLPMDCVAKFFGRAKRQGWKCRLSPYA